MGLLKEKKIQTTAAKLLCISLVSFDTIMGISLIANAEYQSQGFIEEVEENARHGPLLGNEIATYNPVELIDGYYLTYDEDVGIEDPVYEEYIDEDYIDEDYIDDDYIEDDATYEDYIAYEYMEGGAIYEDYIETPEVIHEDLVDIALEDESLIFATALEGQSRVDHDLFTFDAFINQANILDGTAPFDNDDEPGHDSGVGNGIVRTFDTITYPLNITINPHGVEALHNIELMITGELENGITFPNGTPRANAGFAVGGSTNISEGIVSFEQTYTLSQTGTSIMLPIVVEVQGAEHGLLLTPTINVQIMRIDGEDVSAQNITRSFHNIPGVLTSGRVSLRTRMANVTGGNPALAPISVITNDLDDRRNYMAVSVDIGLQSFRGGDPRGATFPVGRINYKIETESWVDWDNGDSRTHFDGTMPPVQLLDHQPIGSGFVNNRVGREHTLFEGKTYNFRFGNNFSTPQSRMTNLNNQNTINTQSTNHVWHSGDWFIEPLIYNNGRTTVTGWLEDYIIGTTFPRRRSDNWQGEIFGVNERVFATHSFLFVSPNAFRIGGEHNPNNIGNTSQHRFVATIISYEDHYGNVTPINHSATVTLAERNTNSGTLSVVNSMRTHPQNQSIGAEVVGDGVVSHGTGTVLQGLVRG